MTEAGRPGLRHRWSTEGAWGRGDPTDLRAGPTDHSTRRNRKSRACSLDYRSEVWRKIFAYIWSTCLWVHFRHWESRLETKGIKDMWSGARKTKGVLEAPSDMVLPHSRSPGFAVWILLHTEVLVRKKWPRIPLALLLRELLRSKNWRFRITANLPSSLSAVTVEDTGWQKGWLFLDPMPSSPQVFPEFIAGARAWVFPCLSLLYNHFKNQEEK